MRFIVLGTVVALAGLMASARGTAAEEGKNGLQLGKVRHVVLFKFKDGTTAEQQKSVEDAFCELPRRSTRSSASSGARTSVRRISARDSPTVSCSRSTMSKPATHIFRIRPTRHSGKC